MAAPNVKRCDLCAKNICSLIISAKLLFDYVFRNNYSKSWERSLPQPERVKQRRKRNHIFVFQMIAVVPAVISLLLTANGRNSYGATSTKMLISYLATIVYLLTFWYVTYAREEFRVIHRAWHTSLRRELYSKIRMPEHVKLIVVIVSIAEIVAPIYLQENAAWFLVTVLQFSSYYSLRSVNLTRLFSRFRPGDNELRYMVE